MCKYRNSGDVENRIMYCLGLSRQVHISQPYDRAYATVLRPSVAVVCLAVVCETVTLCIVAKRCVLEQSYY